MSSNLGGTYVGGKGSVKTCKKVSKGLRNKRKSFWSKIHMAAKKEQLRRAKEERRGRNDRSDYGY